jgi:hypothetical protein
MTIHETQEEENGEKEAVMRSLNHTSPIYDSLILLFTTRFFD